jgi:ERCC4-type nuclease
LRKSGINNFIYLIEEFGSVKHMSLPYTSLLKADVNTQLIDNFIVHHTTDPKDSAHYLIEMTKYLTNKYQVNIKKYE